MTTRANIARHRAEVTKTNSIHHQAVKDLGLELKSRKALVETIIVDRVEKTPTAN